MSARDVDGGRGGTGGGYWGVAGVQVHVQKPEHAIARGVCIPKLGCTSKQLVSVTAALPSVGVLNKDLLHAATPLHPFVQNPPARPDQPQQLPAHQQLTKLIGHLDTDVLCGAGGLQALELLPTKPGDQFDLVRDLDCVLPVEVQEQRLSNLLQSLLVAVCLREHSSSPEHPPPIFPQSPPPGPLVSSFLHDMLLSRTITCKDETEMQAQLIRQNQAPSTPYQSSDSRPA